MGVVWSYVVNVLDGGVWCFICDCLVVYIGGGFLFFLVVGIVEVDGVKVFFILGGIKLFEGGGECVGDGCFLLGGGKVMINFVVFRYCYYWYMLKD